MVVVKVFVVTKNEYDLIEDWTHFYGKLFDYANLYIIDTGSNHPDVLTFYSKARDMGAHVIIDPGYTANSQGEKFTKYMNQVKSQNDSDFLLGCDTDNFLVLHGKHTINKQDYIDYFNSLPADRNKFRIHSSMDSVVRINDKYNNNKYSRPVTDTPMFYNGASVCINFYRTQQFVATTNGNHVGYTMPDQEPLMTRFRMIHYHYTGMTRMFERALEVCKGYEYFHVNLNDDTFDKCKENHLNVCKYISDSGLQHAGIHRLVQTFAFTNRRYVYLLFIKYASREYITINNFYRVLYATDNVIPMLNNQPIGSSIVEESVNNIPGILVNIKSKLNSYGPRQLEHDFMEFFKDKPNDVNIQDSSLLTFGGILSCDEQTLSDHCIAQYHAYDHPPHVHTFLTSE